MSEYKMLEQLHFILQEIKNGNIDDELIDRGINFVEIIREKYMEEKWTIH